MNDYNETWKDLAKRAKDEDDANTVAAVLVCFFAAPALIALWKFVEGMLP